MRLLKLLKYDVKFQLRHGFYYAYLFICILYVIMLRFLPIDIRKTAGILIMFSDPAAIGFFFIGGIILLEKGQSILDSLFVTPTRLHEYLVSKVVSLALLSLVSACVICYISFGTEVNLLFLVAGVLLSSIFFTLVGITLAVRIKTLNQYIMTSPLYIIVLYLPLVEVLGI